MTPSIQPFTLFSTVKKTTEINYRKTVKYQNLQGWIPKMQPKVGSHCDYLTDYHPFILKTSLYTHTHRVTAITTLINTLCSFIPTTYTLSATSILYTITPHYHHLNLCMPCSTVLNDCSCLQWKCSLPTHTTNYMKLVTKNLQGHTLIPPSTKKNKKFQFTDSEIL
jgi:hypothetical protein